MESFEDLKVGDEVAICGSFYGPMIETVSHISQTRVVAGAFGYRKKDGQRVGGGRMHLSRLTPELRAEIEDRVFRDRAVYTLRETQWRRLTIDQLRAVLSLVESFDAPTTPKAED